MCSIAFGNTFHAFMLKKIMFVPAFFSIFGAAMILNGYTQCAQMEKAQISDSVLIYEKV